MAYKKGILIDLEGGEGSGKSTLLRRAKRYFGNRVVFTREPGGSKYAEKLRKLILDSEFAAQASPETMFFLFFAARFDHIKNTVMPALKKGKIVITDRYDASTFGYQIVAQKARHLERLFWDIRCEFMKDYKPDIYVYLDMDPKVGLARKNKQKDVKKNHFDRRKLKFHRELRNGYKEFLEDHYHDIKSVMIDAEKSKKEVWEEFKKIVDSLK